MLEEKMMAVDTAADQAGRLSKEFAATIKKLRKSSETGDLNQLGRCFADFSRIVERLQQLGGEISSILDFPEEKYLGSEDFISELAAAAHASGVRAGVGVNTLYSYPLAVRVLPQKRALLMGKTKDSRLRPTFVARQLKKQQETSGRMPETIFLEILYTVYKLLVGVGSAGFLEYGKVVQLADVYGALTLLPNVSKDYTRYDFSVDIYRLDKSRLQATKDGKHMSLPASTGTRSPSTSLTIVSEAGQEISYYGVAFNESTLDIRNDDEPLA